MRVFIIVFFLYGLQALGVSSFEVISNGLEAIEGMSRFHFEQTSCPQSIQMKSHTTDPEEVVSKVMNELSDLFDEYHRCKAKEKLLSSLEYKEYEAECRKIKKKLDNKILDLNNNNRQKSGVGVLCQSENDNSILTYITKNRSHAGDDQGDTATHWCQFTYYDKSGGRYVTRATSELFTDILGVSLDGIHNLSQVSIERLKIEAVYEWYITNKTQVGLGAYLSKIQQGNGDTFGSAMQNRWHRMNNLYTLENLTDPSLDELPAYGAGIIGSANTSLFQKNGSFYDYSLGANAKLELGLEASRFRGDFRAGMEAQATLEPFKSKVISPYIGLNTRVYNQSVLFGDELESDTFGGFGVRVGSNINFRNGDSFQFEAAANHNQSLIENREITSRAERMGNQGEARVSNIGSTNFTISASLIYRIGNGEIKKLNDSELNTIKNEIQALEQDISNSRDLVEVSEKRDLIIELEKVLRAQ